MAAQVEVQTGEVGRTVAGGRPYMSPLTDSSNKSLSEIPSISESHINVSEADKPAPSPKPRLTPKPFAVEKNPTIKPILAPKPQTKLRPESTRLAGCKPELPNTPKPSPKPVSTNPNRPASTSFRTANKLNTGQTIKPVVQPFKPAPPIDLAEPSKPTRPVPAERQKPAASSLVYSKSLKTLSPTEWSGTTAQQHESKQNGPNKGGTSITRAKSMGSLFEVEKEEEEKKDKVQPEVSVILRPQPRSPRPRPVSAIFSGTPTKTETPDPAPRWTGRRPLSADLTSRFESIGLSLHRKSPKANTKENTPTEKEQDKSPNFSTPESTEGVATPTLLDQNDKKAEKTTVKDAGIKSHVSHFLDSSSPLAADASGQDLHSPLQPVSEPSEPSVGVRQLIKQLTEDTTPTQSPVLKPTPKPRPLPLDLTKRFSSERSPDLVSVTEAADHIGISKDPQTGTEESAVTPNDHKMFWDFKDSPDQLKNFPSPEGSEAGQLWAASKESGAGDETHTVRASLFDNVVERQKVLMMEQGESANTAKDSLSKKEEVEDKGTLVTATYKEPISPSSPLRVSHAFDTMQAVEQNRAVSESVPVAQWEDKAMTLRSRRSEANRSVVDRNEPAQTQAATAPKPETQPRYLRVGALHKWTTSYLDGDAGPDIGALKESDWEGQVALDKDQDRQRVGYQDEVSAPPKRSKLQVAEEQTKPRATYFALTGQMQEPSSPGDGGIKFGDTPFDDFSVRSGSQGKAFPARRNPSLEESFGKPSQSYEKFDEFMLRNPTSSVDLRSQIYEQRREEITEADKLREQKKEAERLRAKAKELEKEKQRMKELEMQRHFQRQRQEALEKEKKEFEEKERALERQKQAELENQRLQELEKKQQREIEKERQWQLQKEKQELEMKREAERDKKREKEKQRQREEERQREMDKKKQLMQEMERMKEMERQQMLEFQKLKQKEKEMQQLVEFEKQRQRENAEKEAEKLRQMALEQEMLKLRELEKEKAREKEMEIERQKEIEREKQRELEKQRRERELEKERQRQKEEEKQRQLDKEKQMMEEMERVKEMERQKVLEFQKQKQKEKEMQQLAELEKQRQREKEEREAERLRQISLEQEMLRLKELEKERARQKEIEMEWKMQKEMERQRQQDLEREKQRQLDFERQQLEIERLRREQEKERKRKEELESLKEMEKRQLLEFEKQKQAEREKQNLELEKCRQKEKMEKEEAEKMRQIAKQQEAERQRIKEKQKKEEQERIRLESLALRPKVLDLDTVLRNDQLSKPSSPRSDPATRWREPYKPAILDIDFFTSQTQPSSSKDMLAVSGIQGLVDESGVRPQPTPERDVNWKMPSLTAVGFSSPAWTTSPQDPWELRPVEAPVAKPIEPKKSTNKLSPEELLFKQEEPPPYSQRNWSAFFNESLSSASSPGTGPKTVNASHELFGSTPGEQVWIPKELQSPQKSRVETKNHRRSHGFQDRMRSRSMSRRSAPSSSAEETSLFRMRSRSAHREQDRPNWVQQNQSGEETEKDTGTPVRDTDSQYGTWETGLRSDDSLTPATPSSDSNLSPSPRKPTPLHSPGDPTSQLDTDTLDGVPPLSSSDSQPLPFPDAPTALLDNSVLRSRAQLGKKRAPRTRPSKAARLSVVQTQVDGGTSEDWLYKDSTEAKAEGKDDDSESEEKTRGADAGPAVASQPQRVALFPGVDPSALKAQLKKRSDSDNQTNGPGPSPSVSRSPKSPFLPRAARVLPQPGMKENSEEDSPQWLKELKSKKRLSQYESET